MPRITTGGTVILHDPGSRLDTLTHGGIGVRTAAQHSYARAGGKGQRRRRRDPRAQRSVAHSDRRSCNEPAAAPEVPAHVAFPLNRSTDATEALGPDAVEEVERVLAEIPATAVRDRLERWPVICLDRRVVDGQVPPASRLARRRREAGGAEAGAPRSWDCAPQLRDSMPSAEQVQRWRRLKARPSRAVAMSRVS